jgi:hypothetical protein
MCGKWHLITYKPGCPNARYYRTLIGVLWAAFVFKCAGWQVKFYRTGARSADEVVRELKSRCS